MQLLSYHETQTSQLGNYRGWELETTIVTDSRDGEAVTGWCRAYDNKTGEVLEFVVGDKYESLSSCINRIKDAIYRRTK